MIGWHRQLDEHEFERAPGVSDGQGSLVCDSPWGGKDSDTIERLSRTERRTKISHTVWHGQKEQKGWTEGLRARALLGVRALWYLHESGALKNQKREMVYSFVKPSITNYPKQKSIVTVLEARGPGPR